MDTMIGLKVDRVLCHNAIVVINDHGKRGVVTGKGIGFNQKPGNLVEDRKIESLYIEYKPRDKAVDN
jgi:beta-glucoside operon transcriptional antiterminator